LTQTGLLIEGAETPRNSKAAGVPAATETCPRAIPGRIFVGLLGVSALKSLSMDYGRKLDGT
jgi:hypothetical protein